MYTRKQTRSSQVFIVMIRRSVFIITVIMSLSMIFFCVTSCQKGYKNEAGGQGVYVYSWKEFFRVLQTAGYPISWGNADFELSRNSVGTELRFVHPTQHHNGLILSCDGSIREIVVPGHPVWFNDAHQVVAWRTRGQMHYTYGGQQREPISSAFRSGEEPDPAGKFFIRNPHAAQTEIYSIEQPYQSLATISSLCGWDGIYFKHNTLFVFADSCHVEQVIDGTELHIFQVEGKNLKEKETIGIPGAEHSADFIFVEDFSPWSNEVLLESVHDFERSVYYVFHIRTHEMKKLGKEPFRGGFGFFLSCDILQKVMERVQERRTNE